MLLSLVGITNMFKVGDKVKTNLTYLSKSDFDYSGVVVSVDGELVLVENSKGVLFEHFKVELTHVE